MHESSCWPKQNVVADIEESEKVMVTNKCGLCWTLYVLRRKTMKKVFITLSSCGVMRALHLKLASDLSTETFKQNLKKFTARRGTPSVMVSDNAKTFQATANWSKKLYRGPAVQRYLHENNIQWRFSLALAL